MRLIKNGAPEPRLTVVGVIPDILQNFRRPLEHDPLIYLPYAQEPQREMFILAKVGIPPQTLASAMRSAVQKIDPNLAVYDLATLENRIAQSRLSVTLLGGMLSIFAGIALVLATIGLYAVTAHSIGQRIQEIGVRIAIGGTRRDILRLVFAQGLQPMMLGTIFGVPAAIAVTRALRMTLVGVSPSDPVTLLTVVLLLSIAAIAGCAIPAARAINVDPVVALRYE